MYRYRTYDDFSWRNTYMSTLLRCSAILRLTPFAGDGCVPGRHRRWRGGAHPTLSCRRCSTTHDSPFSKHTGKCKSDVRWHI